MTEQEMLEAEKYWCENCCNWDKEKIQMDACSTCKLTGTRVFAQESGKECKCFNVPAENVIVPPCKVGQTVYVICYKKVVEGKVRLIRPFISEKGINFKGNVICEIDNLFLDNGTKEEIELYVTFDKSYEIKNGIDRMAYFNKEEAEQALRKEQNNE